MTHSTPDLLREYRAACDEFDRLSDLMRRNKLKSLADFRNYQNAILRRGEALKALYPIREVA